MSKEGAVIVAGAAIGFGVWWFYGRQKLAAYDPQNWFDDVAGSVSQSIEAVAIGVDELTGGLMKVSNMSKVTAADVQDKNVQAFLRVIRRGEGTADPDGYRRIFGGQLFTSYADHPRIVVSKSGYKSSAAGAYQFIISTWDETKRIMGLTDFSPASQDLGAVGRIMARGALEDVKAGRFELAIKKCAREWASLPYSPYGQPVITMATADAVYRANGGKYEILGATV